MADVIFEVSADITSYDKNLKELQTSTTNAANNVQASMDRATSGVAQSAESNIGRAGAAIQSFGARIQDTGKKVSTLGSTLSKTLTLGIVAAASAAGYAAVKIDSALTDVKKTVDGTEEQYQQLKSAAIEFSKTNAVPADQILTIQSLGSQLGFAITELELFGRVAAGLDISTNMNAEQAGSEMVQFANITRMGHDEIENYASAIVGLGNNFATTEADVSAMSMRIAAAGTQIGMSQADILGMATALSSLGINAEAGGSSISTVMSKIDKAVAQGGESLQTWANAAGMSADQFAKAWAASPVDALTAVLDGMNGMVDSGNNMNLILKDLGITELRQVDALKRMAGNTDLVREAVAKGNEEWANNTALQAEVDNRNQSLAARFEMLKNRVIALAEQFGGPLCDALLDMVDAAEPIFEVISNGATAFADLDEDSQRVILTFIALAAAAGPVLKVVGGTMQKVEAFGKVLTGASSIIKNFSKNMSATAPAATGAAKAVQSASKATTQATKAATQATSATTNMANSQRAAAAATTAQSNASKYAAGSARAFAAQQSATAASNTAVATTATVATGAVTALKAALGAIGIGLAVTAVSSLVSVLIDMATSSDKAGESMDGMTAKSKEQAAEVSRLEEEYRNACDTQGESSEAALKAKAAYEQEREAFENSKQTIEEYCDELDDSIDAHKDLIESVQEAAEEADTQAGVILNLADEVADLTKTENRSAEQKTELAAKTKLLNDALGKEMVKYDSVTDSVSMNADAIRELASAEANRLRGSTAMDNYTRILQEQATVAGELADVETELEQTKKTTIDTSSGVNVAITKETEESKRLNETKDELIQKQTELNDEQEKAWQTVEQCAAHDEALAQAVEAVTEGTMSAAEASEKYGEGLELALSESEVSAVAAEEQAEAMENLSKKAQKCSEDITEFANTNPAFRQAMSESGLKADDLAKSLTDLGFDADILIDRFSTVADSTCNAFDKIEQKSDISLQEMLENLQYNAEVTKNWSDNLTYLYDNAGSTAVENFIGYLEQMGPSAAPILQQLRDDNTGMLDALADAYAQGGDVVWQYADRFGLATDQIATDTEEATACVHESMGAMNEDISTGGTEAGEAYTEGLAAAIAAAPEEVQEYIATLEAAVENYESMESAGTTSGDAYSAALSTAIANAAPEVQTYISQLEGKVKQYEPNFVTAGESGGKGIGGGVAYGISSQAGTVQSSAASLGTAAQMGLNTMPLYGAQQGQQLGASTAAGVASQSPRVAAAANTLSNAAKKGLGKFNGQPQGSAGAQAFANGIASKYNVTAEAAQSLEVAASSPLSTLKFAAYGWGSDFVSQYAAGMRSQFGTLAAAADDAAETIRERTHFTVPDKGPLSDADEYGPDFVKLLAGGIRDNVSILKHASSEAAQATRDGFSDGIGALRWLAIDANIPNTDRAVVSFKESSNTSVINELAGLEKAIRDAIKESMPKEVDAYITNWRMGKEVMTR